MVLFDVNNDHFPRVLYRCTTFLDALCIALQVYYEVVSYLLFIAFFVLMAILIMNLLVSSSTHTHTHARTHVYVSARIHMSTHAHW